MKAILFISALLFSSLSNAATFTGITGGADNPAGGYYGYGIGSTFVEGYKDPFIYKDAVDIGYEDDENYFAIGTDLVDRSMSNGTSYAVDNPSLNPVKLFIEWTTFDVFNASFYFDGNSINLPGTGMGSFYYTLLETGDLFVTSFAIGGKANSLDSFVEYRFTEIVQTPIPASMFLFAPALLGFMGLRRKAKLS